MCLITLVRFLVLLIFVCHCAGSGNGNESFPSMLRRRTGRLVKREEQPLQAPVVAVAAPGYDGSPSKAPDRKFIRFGLRAGQTGSEDSSRVRTFSFGSAFNGLFSGVSKIIHAIDDLERDHAKSAREQPPILNSSEFIRNILEKAKMTNFDSSGDEEDDDAATRSSENDVKPSDSEEEEEQVDIEGDDAASSEEEQAFEDESVSLDDDEESPAPAFIYPVWDDPTSEVEEGQDIMEEVKSIEQQPLIPETQIIKDADRLLHVKLIEDSDFEDWISVESNIFLNLQALVQQPKRELKKPTGLVFIDFLSTIFVKLAKRILLVKPHEKMIKSKKESSFVIDESAPVDGGHLTTASSIEDFEKVPTLAQYAVEESRLESYLSFDKAYVILFYNVLDQVETKISGSETCRSRSSSGHKRNLILPKLSDYMDALEFLSFTSLEQLDQIKSDVLRLPPRYMDYISEHSGSILEKITRDELYEKIMLVLAFVLTNESSIISGGADDDESVSKDTNVDPPITYTQGFDQIAAYFVINFDLSAAGPFAYRFLQMYLSDFIGSEDNLGLAARAQDSFAISLVRSYLKEESKASGVMAMNMMRSFEVFLGILDLYPFSDRSATIMYFNSAITFKDLDALMQFLLIKVPSHLASRSVGLLAAANMLYCMLALDELFVAELGAEKWAHVKTSLGEDPSALDELVQRFMGEMFLAFSGRIVHSGSEFGGFLKVAEMLLPHMDAVIAENIIVEAAKEGVKEEASI